MKNKNLFVIIFLLLLSCKNKVDYNHVNYSDLNKNKIYLLFRGTNSKQGNTAKKYNLKDSLVTHVGITYYNGDDWQVFHVLGTNNIETDLNIESIGDFFDSNKNKTYYGSIWEVEKISLSQRQKIIEKINKLSKMSIKFDNSFSSKKENELYCSEFIIKIFESLNTNDFIFEKQKIKLESFHSIILKRDSLEYYPVDVFFNNRNITKIKEWNFY